MKLIVVFLLLLVTQYGYSQSIVEWSSSYEVQFQDFQSPQTEVNGGLNSYSIITGTTLDFAYQMSRAQFIFTKNFNSKVRAIFNKNAAVISAPDSSIARNLVLFGQYSFDVTELYARKFRKELYEKKGAFSDASFFRPIFQKLQNEMNQEISRVLKLTDLGTNSELLEVEHQKVLAEIESLSSFCKKCKLKKRKK